MLVQTLLDSKVDMSSKDEDGKSALHVASESSATAVVTLLLSRGANVAAVDMV